MLCTGAAACISQSKRLVTSDPVSDGQAFVAKLVYTTRIKNRTENVLRFLDVYRIKLENHAERREQPSPGTASITLLVLVKASCSE